MLPPIDAEDGYLTDEWLDALRAAPLAYDFRAAARFLVETLPQAAGHVSCCSVLVEDGVGEWSGGPMKRIEFHTGGWSGAEELIDAALSHFAVRHYQSMWRRGGHFYFEVPLSALAPTIEARSAETQGLGPKGESVTAKPGRPSLPTMVSVTEDPQP